MIHYVQFWFGFLEARVTIPYEANDSILDSLRNMSAELITRTKESVDINGAAVKGDIMLMKNEIHCIEEVFSLGRMSLTV